MLGFLQMVITMLRDAINDCVENLKDGIESHYS